MASIQDLDARQRMINMMYLMFIAMLALNMSKEVLQAFGDVNDSLQANIEQVTARNNSLMSGLAQKAEEQNKKYGPLQEQALVIDASGTDLVSFIDQIKKDLLSNVKKEDDGTYNYEKMDSDSDLNLMFIANDKLSDRAKELKNKIATFREDAAKLARSANNESMAEAIERRFSTDPVITRDKTKEEWIRHHFEGFPLIAGITKLTNIQSDAKQTQSQLLTNILSGQMESDLSLENYQTIVIPDKGAFFSSENFKGKIVLGRYDNTMTFDKVEINGKAISDIDGGVINVDFPAGNVGEQKLKGKVYYTENGEKKSLPINSSYTVIPKPNSAVISADKMNVVYRGVSNPMTISIPGVSRVTASAPGLSSRGNSKYVMNPTGIKGREVKISVSGSLPDGTKISDTKTFRIKDIPNPVGTVRGQNGLGGPIKMQKGDLKISTVSAILPDFDFDLNLAVSGFKIQVPGKPIVVVRGQKMNAAAQRTIDSAPRGSIIQIFDIEASIQGNSSYHLKRVAPVTIQLTN